MFQLVNEPTYNMTALIVIIQCLHWQIWSRSFLGSIAHFFYRFRLSWSPIQRNDSMPHKFASPPSRLSHESQNALEYSFALTSVRFNAQASRRIARRQMGGIRSKPNKHLLYNLCFYVEIVSIVHCSGSSGL